MGTLEIEAGKCTCNDCRHGKMYIDEYVLAEKCRFFKIVSVKFLYSKYIVPLRRVFYEYLDQNPLTRLGERKVY